MKICYFGFTHMDYKGEEINEITFLKKVSDKLLGESEQFYLYSENSDIGLNSLELYEKFGIKARRISIDKYTEFPYEEYSKYSAQEIENIIFFNKELSIKKNNVDISEQLKLYTIKYLENIKEYDEQYEIELYLFWGNSLQSHVIRAYCLKNNKKFVNLENGYFRPFTMMVDDAGVNYEGSVPRHKEFYEAIEINKTRFESFLYQPEVAFPDTNTVEQDREMFYDHYNLDVIKRNITPNIDNTPFDFAEEYIYVPFQLELDSQIIKHSTHITKMKQLVEFISSALYTIRKKLNRDIKMVFKCHPLYKTELDILDLDGIKKICDNDKNLLLVYEADNKKLIEHSMVVVTINSTVGFEALGLHKPVILLGDAMYGIEGIANKFNFQSDFSDFVIEVLQKPINHHLIDKFLYYLRFEYFHEIYRAFPDDVSVESLVNKLLAKTSLC